MNVLFLKKFSMRIISWNVNGLRAVERKEEWGKMLENYAPDIVLIQEIKCKSEQIESINEAYPYYAKFYHSAEKKGYAGTGIWISKNFMKKSKDMKFSTSMPDFNDDEGRISRVDFKDFSVLGVYFPNGGKSKEAWEGKLVFYEKFLEYINQLRNEGRKVVWAGDVNCAHQEIDLARPKDNNGKIGFHPLERNWVSKAVEQGWIDVWREKNPDVTDVYSWWHVITRSRLRNVGWRIDYFFVNKASFPTVKKIEYLNDQMGSDHCPVLMEI